MLPSLNEWHIRALVHLSTFKTLNVEKGDRMPFALTRPGISSAVGYHSHTTMARYLHALMAYGFVVEDKALVKDSPRPRNVNTQVYWKCYQITSRGRMLAEVLRELYPVEL
jgi:hypothetical protein